MPPFSLDIVEFIGVSKQSVQMKGLNKLHVKSCCDTQLYWRIELIKFNIQIIRDILFLFTLNISCTAYNQSIQMQ